MFNRFLCLSPWPWLGPPLAGLRYVLLGLRKTSYLSIMGRRPTAYFNAGAESDIYGFLIHLVRFYRTDRDAKIPRRHRPMRRCQPMIDRRHWCLLYWAIPTSSSRSTSRRQVVPCWPIHTPRTFCQELRHIEPTATLSSTKSNVHPCDYIASILTTQLRYELYDDTKQAYPI